MGADRLWDVLIKEIFLKQTLHSSPYEIRNQILTDDVEFYLFIELPKDIFTRERTNIV